MYLRRRHAGQVLDGAADAARRCRGVGRDRLARLADLVLVVHPAGVHDRARGADRRAEGVGQVLDRWKFSGPFSPRPPETMICASVSSTLPRGRGVDGRDPRRAAGCRPCPSTISALRDASGFSSGNTFGRRVAICGSPSQRDGRVGLARVHRAGAPRSRPSFDGEGDAVRDQARAQPRRHARGQVLAHRRERNEHGGGLRPRRRPGPGRARRARWRRRRARGRRRRARVGAVGGQLARRGPRRPGPRRATARPARRATRQAARLATPPRARRRRSFPSRCSANVTMPGIR